jgi:hypothetical protein
MGFVPPESTSNHSLLVCQLILFLEFETSLDFAKSPRPTTKCCWFKYYRECGKYSRGSKCCNCLKRWQVDLCLVRWRSTEGKLLRKFHFYYQHAVFLACDVLLAVWWHDSRRPQVLFLSSTSSLCSCSYAFILVPNYLCWE